DSDSEVVSADLYFDTSKKGSIREGTITGNNIQAKESSGGSNIHFDGNPDSNIKIGLLSIVGNHISNQETLIKLKNVKGISISGNTFIRGYDRHMLIESSDNIVIQGNVFDHNVDYFRGDVNPEGGIRLEASRDVIFSNNILEGIDRGNDDRGAALEIEQCHRISINTSHILNSKFRGIHVTQSDNVSIMNCTLANEGEPMIDGILVSGPCTDLRTEGNHIDEASRGKLHY